MIPPENCTTMAEVRAGVDETDDRIVTLFAIRQRLMEAAARIKSDRSKVRDEERKAAVIRHARAIAIREGASAELVEKVYEALVEASIAYELDRFDERPV